MERKEETFERELRVALTQFEKAEWADTIASLDLKIEELTAAKKSSADSYKSQIEAKEGARRNQSEEVRKGQLRDVQCTRVSDYDEGEVYEVRLDTGEELNRRSLREDEKQLALPMEEESEEGEASDEEIEVEDEAGDPSEPDELSV